MSHPEAPCRRLSGTPLATGLVLVLLSIFSLVVNSQTDMMNYCGEKPCIEPVRMSCPEMIEKYRFQGSCCSMERIGATGGCRITVGFGNCFWYPWCGTCEGEEETASRCNNVFETGAQQECPVGDFDPIEIQASADYTTPSCAPSMAPSMAPPTSAAVNHGYPTVPMILTGVLATVVASLVATIVAA